MYYLRHIDPLCMFRGYVVLIQDLLHRSTVYSGGCAMIDVTTCVIHIFGYRDDDMIMT
jgi:hypothetical protein